MIEIPLKVGGRFRLAARRPDGRLRPLADWQDNLILDIGLDEIAANGTWMDCVQVGTSDVEPAADQTTLQAPLAGTSNRIGANSAAASTQPYRGFSQVSYRFPVGATTGTIKELGIGSSAAPGAPMWSRALVKDVLGNLRPVKVLEDEALEVEYEVSIYAPQVDIIGTIPIDGIDIGYRARAALASTAAVWAPYRAGSYSSAGQAVRALFSGSAGAHYAAANGNIGAATSSPGGSIANASLIKPDSVYVAGSHLRKVRLEWDLDTGNFAGGLKSFLWRMGAGTGAGGNSLGAYQLQLDVPAAKTAEVSFRIDLGISWGRL